MLNGNFLPSNYDGIIRAVSSKFFQGGQSTEIVVRGGRMYSNCWAKEINTIESMKLLNTALVYQVTI